ncbi:MAG TPA: hypothetical protein V6C65_19925, partial [Allocoleopsis sp.]
MRWSRELTVEGLRSAPFDYLRNPPPASVERGYENSRDTTWEPTGNANLGEIIGRVYYVRGIPTEFWADYSGWLGKLPASLVSDSGSHKYYTLTVSLFLSSGLAVWVFIERVLAQKRLQKRLAQQEEQRLLKQLEQQEHLLAELESYRDEQEASIHSLKQEISKYRNKLKQTALEQRRSVQGLESLNCQLQEVQQLQVQGEEQLQQKEQAIVNLQARIKAQERENQQRDKSLKLLQNTLQVTQEKLASKSSTAQSLDNTIASISQERGLD